MQDLSCRKVPQNSALRDRPAHPCTIPLGESCSTQATLGPQEHRTFLKEAYNAAICFKMLRDLNSLDPYRLKYLTNKIKAMARGTPNLVLETIHHYFIDNPEISNRHKLQLLHVLETIIGASDSLEDRWRESFMKLALETMTKSTLEEVYQDAASNVLLAICRHSWQTVTQHLDTEVLTGIFPHRSLLYVMGVLTSNEKLFNQGEQACWKEQLTQIAAKSVQFLKADVWSKELLWALTKPDRTNYEQPSEKAFLFVYYGLILQAEENGAMVRTHLRTLLETSQQWSKQREGIALTVGLAAARHLDHVWAVLEQFGRSAPIKRSLHSFSPKLFDHVPHLKHETRAYVPADSHPILTAPQAQTSKDLRWKWATSTVLLAYGQMAAKAKAHILPWVDNILSCMIFYFHCSSWDETLKQSFLAAILLLVGAVSRNEGAHSYEFSQLSQLFECLMALMEKEPQDSLCSLTRGQTIHIISSLCKLRPPLDSEKKSQLLSVCLRSVLALPLLDVLDRHTCLFLEPPNVQTLYSKTSKALDEMLQTFIIQNPTADELHFLLSHLYLWLESEKAHERQRAVHTCTALLQFLSHSHYLEPKEDFKQIWKLMGMLGILCQDPDRATQRSGLQGLGHLHQLLLRHREALRVDALAPEQLSQANEDEAPLWSSGDQKATLPTPEKEALPKDCIFRPGSFQVMKEIMKHLTVAELTDLTWTAIDSLGSGSTFRVQAAANRLLTVIQERGAELETVANLGRAIHLQLRCGRIPQAQENALRAITLRARNHIPELVVTFLDFSVPPDSHAFQLWRALGAEQHVSRQVLAVLLALLRERPLPKEKAYLRSLAMSLGQRPTATLQGSELQHPPPPGQAMNTLHELQVTREFKRAVQEAYPQLLLAFLAQIHYILELSLPTGLQPGQQAPEAATPSPQRTSLEALKSLLSSTGHWQDFAHLELQGAWVLFSTAHTYPQGVSLLASLALLEVLSKQDALKVLARSLRDPSPEVQVLSLQGLGNVLFQPEKHFAAGKYSSLGLSVHIWETGVGSLLRGQLPLFLDGFLQSSEPVLECLTGTVSEVPHRLGACGVGVQCLSVAIHARSSFGDERDRIRAAAMALFGDLVAAMAGREPSSLRAQVYQSMVPLLLHLKDHCPAVITQATFAFYRCAALCHWPLQHTLFGSLAWERGLGAHRFLWTCLMTHSKTLSIHLAQALSYLHSPHHHTRTWAALFLGYTICYHPQAVSQTVNDADMKLLLCTFEDFRKDPEPGLQEFATKQVSFLQEVAARRQ